MPVSDVLRAKRAFVTLFTAKRDRSIMHWKGKMLDPNRQVCVLLLLHVRATMDWSPDDITDKVLQGKPRQVGAPLVFAVTGPSRDGVRRTVPDRLGWHSVPPRNMRTC